MRVTLNTSEFARTRWHEYVSRFLFGGAITALAGIIAREYGPGIGGLFLAFPAIFPAGATLIEKHEKRRNRKQSTLRGRKAAALDAAGAAMGAFGLVAFALVVWKLIEHLPLWAVLSSATFAWLGVSIVVWRIRQFC
jgi:Protein of unknown function (DUF3147)